MVLNIDMDYFLNRIHYSTYNSNKRLDSNEYIPWRKEEFTDFIENKLGLNKKFKIRGKLCVHHHEAFYYWREAIEKGFINIPFKIIHIDAHIDLSYFPDGSWMYIKEKYLNKSYIENISRKFKGFGRIR